MALIEVDWKPGVRQLRTFGALLTLACLGLAFAADVSPRLAAALTYASVASAVLTAFAPRALRGPYVVLLAASLPIGIVVSHLVMAILFYLVVTPYALVFRLLGRDALARRFEPERPSYWTPRPVVKDLNRYYRQY